MSTAGARKAGPQDDTGATGVLRVVTRRAWQAFSRNDLSGIALSTLVLFVALSVTSSGFLSAFNLTSILQDLAVFAVIGVAQMIVLSLGQFNLAVGSIGVLSAMLMGFFMQILALPIVLSLAAGVLIAGFLGFVQGQLVARSGISPFIITLALLSVYAGTAYVFTRGKPFQSLPSSFMQWGNIDYGIVPLVFVIALAIYVVVFLGVRYLPIGKQMLACGANPRAAVLTGIRLERTTVIGHTLSGFLCGFAAILEIIRFGSAQLSIGSDWMLSSFLAPVLGGTLLSGGKISVPGTLLGALMVVLIQNALVLWGVSTYESNIFLGLILLLAFEVDRWRRDLAAGRRTSGKTSRQGGKE